MATPNRGTRIAKLIGQIKKVYKPVPPPKNRTLLEHLLFACLLENSPHDATEEAFEKLQTEYFDWNEVRVSTKRELADTLKGLVDPSEAAERLKKTLHSVFESVYAFDLEPLKKQNLGQATKQIEKYAGTTTFAVAYVTQNALGGHAIPSNQGLLTAFMAFDLLTEAEARSGLIPGLERAIPKTKGYEVGTILHQLGVEVGRNPYGQNARKVLLTIDPGAKDRLPKKPEPVAPAEPPKAKVAKSRAKEESKGSPKTATKTGKESAKPAAAPKKAKPASDDAASGAAKKAPKKVAKPTKPATKKVAPKKTKSAGTPVKKTTKAKPATKKITKRKPR